MKRKFIGLILCFTLFSMSILTGCSLFTRNTKMYYDTVVATVEKDGKTINITKKELIETYSSYGAMYEQYYDYTTKEAYDMSLTLLENKKITIIDPIKQKLEENKKTMTHCPECGTEMQHSGGCVCCPQCSWSACN